MPKKPWKIITIISLCAVLFFSFGGSAAADDDYLKIISDLTKQLEESNNSLINVVASNEKLAQSVLKLEHENSILKEENTDLKVNNSSSKEVSELKTALKETTQSLIDTTNLMEEMTNQSEKDQAEIEDLRKNIKDILAQMDKEKFFGVNLGVIYPWGFQVGFNADLPKIPFGFYFNIGLQFVEKNPLPLFGGGLRFRF